MNSCLFFRLGERERERERKKERIPGLYKEKFVIVEKVKIVQS